MLITKAAISALLDCSHIFPITRFHHTTIKWFIVGECLSSCTEEAAKCEKSERVQRGHTLGARVERRPVPLQLRELLAKQNSAVPRWFLA